MNRLKLFVVSILAVNLIGTVVVDSRYLSKKIIFPPKASLDTTFEMERTKVKATKDANHIKNLNTIVLKINLKNNTSYPLTNMKLIVANKGIDVLETPSALRFQHLPLNQSESAFKIPDLSAGSKRSAEIILYAKEPGTYSTKVYVENDEKVKSSTDIITFIAE